MAAMLQQQYVVQETEPRDWAACALLNPFFFTLKPTEKKARGPAGN